MSWKDIVAYTVAEGAAALCRKAAETVVEEVRDAYRTRIGSPASVVYHPIVPPVATAAEVTAPVKPSRPPNKRR